MVSKTDRAMIKDIIGTRLKENGEITTKEVAEIIKPFYDIQSETAVDQILRKHANRYIAGFRDKNGSRECFAYEEDGESTNIHVGCTDNKEALTRIESNLARRIMGLTASHNKVSARLRVLDGQVSLFDLDVAEM